MFCVVGFFFFVFAFVSNGEQRSVLAERGATVTADYVGEYTKPKKDIRYRYYVLKYRYVVDGVAFSYNTRVSKEVWEERAQSIVLCYEMGNPGNVGVSGECGVG